MATSRGKERGEHMDAVLDKREAMNQTTQRLDDLDTQARGIIHDRYELLKDRARASQAADQAAAKVRAQRRERQLNVIGPDMAAMLQRLRDAEAENDQSTEALVRELKAQWPTSAGLTSSAINASPPVILTDAALLAVLMPYYEYMVDADTAGFVQDAHGSPPPPVRTIVQAGGSGDGWDDQDRNFHTYELSWLFSFTPPETRFYDFYPTTADYGTCTLLSDDGTFTSKVAHASVTLRGAVNSLQGAGGMPTATETVFDRQGDNINEHREMGSPTGSVAQLHIKTLLQANSPTTITLAYELYVYARGGGTRAELDFASDNPHGLGIRAPWCYAF
jgi:hypothetical protein